MSKLILVGDNMIYNFVALTGDSSLGITLADTGTLGFGVEFLGLVGTTSISIGSAGNTGGLTELFQQGDINNALTTVTINDKGMGPPEPFYLGRAAGNSNAGDSVVTDIAAFATSPTKIYSSLRLIDASATTGAVTRRMEWRSTLRQSLPATLFSTRPLRWHRPTL